jgi:N-methylhydantoinase A
VRVANQEMVRALRVVTVERGVDPRGLALMPFGGAGPMHAAGIAEQLDIGSILCPRASGVLSALGLCASDRRRDTARTVMLSEEEMTVERVAREVDQLIAVTAEGMDAAEPRVEYEMRYRGQAFELAVPGPARPDPSDLVERFAAEHEARYGYRDPDGAVELVNIHLAMVVDGPALRPTAAEAEPEESRREARFGGQWVSTRVLRGEPAAGAAAEGPVIFELPEATLVLPPGWSATVDAAGTIVADRSTESEQA